MWANSTSTLKADPSEETGQTTAPEDQTSMGGSTAPGGNPSLGGVSRFRWSPDAVRRLDEDIDWALTSNPAGEAEVAGVLLGKVGPTIEITDCPPVFLMQPPDHAYALAGPGRCEFERTIAAFQSIPDGERSVIGFYRSHTGDGLDLTEEDLGLLGACFRDSSPVVLLIQRTANGSSSAKLFWGDKGEVMHQVHSSETASASDAASALPRWLELWYSLSPVDDAPHTAGADTAMLAHTTELAQMIEHADPVTEYTPILATVEAPKNPVSLERRSSRSPVFLLATALFLSIFTGYLMLRGSARVKQEVAAAGSAAGDVQSGSSNRTGLALRAERHGDNLRLDWDRTAPILVAATGGMLTIREGNGRERQVILDGNLLRTGSVIYRPVHGDVSLRLVIFGQEGAKMGESVSTYPPQEPVSGSDANKEMQ
jgi:hypothetical protein